MKSIEKILDKFKTKHEHGFTSKEIDKILKKFPEINMQKFNNALFGNTCMIIDGDMITYHCDLRKALHCGIENRELRTYEFD